MRYFLSILAGVFLILQTASAQEAEQPATDKTSESEQPAPAPPPQENDSEDPYETFRANKEISYDVPVSFPADI